MPNKKERTILFLVVFFTISMSVTTFLATYFVREYTNMLQESIRQRLILTANEAATLLTYDELEEFTVPRDMQKYEYNEIIKSLRDFSRERGLLYTYFMRLQGDEIVYIFDSDEDESARELLGNPVEEEDALLVAFEGVPSANRFGDYIEGWEGMISAYAPVYNRRGDVVAVAGVDFSDREIHDIKFKANAMTYVICFEVIAFIIVSAIGITSYRKQAKAYKEASLSKSRFLARMSHEIRTPMNAIMGFCRMAKNSKDPGAVKDHLEKISSSSEFLLELINGILDLSKIEAGKFILNPVKTKTGPFMRNIESMMAAQMKAKRLNFNMKTGENIPACILCDDTKLMQIIINLLSNAVKFTPEGGQITLAATRTEDRGNQCRLQFTVTDNGIGIEPEFINSLFEAFEQGDGSITRKYGGTGLGLAISKLLVEKMGGEIYVSSVFGEGSKFEFYGWFEIIREEEQIGTDAAGGDECGAYAGMRFLVVEDNEINRIVAQNALEDELGATVDFAFDGEMGVQRFSESPGLYDIIFMDIQMPVMDGFEATRRIRASGLKNADTIPIIAMSANVFKEDVDMAIESGMNAHIGKPFEPEQIRAAINTVLGI